MSPEELRIRIPVSELGFTASRSGGPGGQNVNKVSTKVELRFNVRESSVFSEREKDIIYLRLKNKINARGEIFLTSQSERTQTMNKLRAEERFFRLMASALTERKKRRATRPTLASKEKRLRAKKERGTIKKLRKDKARNED